MTTLNGISGFSAQQAAKYKAANQDYPLRWHVRGGWCKKIKGRVTYFGKVTPDDALQRYHHEKDFLERGELPPSYDPNAVTIRQLCNEFLAAKESLVESGELSQLTWDGYHRACGHLVRHFGPHRQVVNLHPADFGAFRKKLAKGRGAVSLKTEMTRIKSVLKFASDNELISQPVRYGNSFDPPKRNVIRKARHATGRLDFSPAEIRKLLKATSGQLHAMILLGINAAAENSSVGALMIEQLDLKGGWLDWPRQKTGALRRCCLWSETIKTLREVIGDRIEGEVFHTAFLNRWSDTAINHELRKVLKRLDLVKRGRNFYGLRRSFSTIANETGDRSAVDLVMGHISDESMHDLYVQHVDDDRLRKVSDHVRQRVLCDNPRVEEVSNGR